MRVCVCLSACVRDVFVSDCASRLSPPAQWVCVSLFLFSCLPACARGVSLCLCKECACVSLSSSLSRRLRKGCVFVSVSLPVRGCVCVCVPLSPSAYAHVPLPPFVCLGLYHVFPFLRREGRGGGYHLCLSGNLLRECYCEDKQTTLYPITWGRAVHYWHVVGGTHRTGQGHCLLGASVFPRSQGLSLETQELGLSWGSVYFQGTRRTHFCCVS